MKWLTNTYDPKGPDQELHITRRTHETPEEALAHRRAYLRGKIIGPPKATKHYSVAELQAQGMVGVYSPEGKGGSDHAEDGDG